MPAAACLLLLPHDEIIAVNDSTIIKPAEFGNKEKVDFLQEELKNMRMSMCLSKINAGQTERRFSAFIGYRRKGGAVCYNRTVFKTYYLCV